MAEAPVVLVTAGGSGIGAAIAERFVAAGSRVCFCDVDAAAARGAAMKLGASALFVEADVAEPEQVDALFRRCIEWGGRLDTLVNNAGIGGPRCAIEDTDLDAWSRTLAVNLTGAFACLKAAAGLMKAQDGGCILNISTASVRTGLPYRTAYIASKAGLMGLTLNAARELGPFNIRCNAILPGLVKNARGERLLKIFADEQGLSLEEADVRWRQFTSMRTWIAPEEVGDTAVFLASDAARHITGQYLGVDGHLEWET